MPIYILTLCKIMPGEPTGHIGDLLHDVFLNIKDAEEAYDAIALNALYFKKELWVKNPEGKRKLIKGDYYVTDRA